MITSKAKYRLIGMKNVRRISSMIFLKIYMWWITLDLFNDMQTYTKQDTHINILKEGSWFKNEDHNFLLINTFLE